MKTLSISTSPGLSSPRLEGKHLSRCSPLKARGFLRLCSRPSGSMTPVAGRRLLPCPTVLATFPLQCPERDWPLQRPKPRSYLPHHSTHPDTREKGCTRVLKHVAGIDGRWLLTAGKKKRTVQYLKLSKVNVQTNTTQIYSRSILHPFYISSNPHSLDSGNYCSVHRRCGA